MYVKLLLSLFNFKFRALICNTIYQLDDSKYQVLQLPQTKFLLVHKVLAKKGFIISHELKLFSLFLESIVFFFKIKTLG